MISEGLSGLVNEINVLLGYLAGSVGGAWDS